MSTALIIFAKAPVAGLAKTRLTPALGASGAAALAARLLQHTVEQALALNPDHVELCVSPTLEHPAFVKAVAVSHAKTPANPLKLTLQGEGDLGERMDRALTRALQNHTHVLLIGTDAPALDAPMLHAAARALQTHEAVFVPAFDGGYALVGLAQPAPDLFTAMAWSTPQVMEHTGQRAEQAGLRWTVLPPVADIDEPDDLVHLPKGWLS